MDNRIIIFDTTLRDGEQSPGAALSVSEKVEIARLLDLLRVDVIEAGFPVSSPVQFEAVQRIAQTIRHSRTAALARAVEKDIDAAADALKGGSKTRIHTFIGTSDIHISEKFRDARYGKTLAQKQRRVLEMTRNAVQYACVRCDDVEFSAEDAGRTDIGYLIDVVTAAIEAGATTVNIPDTTGYTMPSEFGRIIATLREKVPGIDKIVLSAHCHNDLGLAVANSLAAIEHGVRQVECTINGIGERAGNASLEEIVMALKVREDYWHVQTNIDIKEILNASKMVSAFTGMVVQPNKAVVGDNAFAHEAGIHQDGVLKNKGTYEIMNPESVGVLQSTIVLGRHSGQHGLKARLEALGYHLTAEELGQMYKRFVELADKKKEVFDDDLRILMGDEIFQPQTRFVLQEFHVSAGSSVLSTGTVVITDGENRYQESSIGDGPVDACLKAVDRALGQRSNLESYRVRSVTAGKEALGEVIVRIRQDGHTFTGRGVSTDVIEASLLAYLHALSEAKNAEVDEPLEKALV